jgi:hypothetical protein
MLKKNIKGLLLLLFLAVLAGILIYKQRKTTIKEELKDFAVTDTAKINKLFIADRKGNKSLLERKSSGYWIVNGKLRARQDAINTLLITISNLSVKSPVPKNAIPTIIKQLAATGIKIEIYLDGDLEKVYYVGPQDMEGTGTYMMIENSSVPFVMEIPGFQGFLTPRYIANPKEWRDKHIFSCKGNEIAEISMIYNKNNDLGFNIKMNEQYKVSLFDRQNKAVSPFDTATVKEYLTILPTVAYDSFVQELKQKTIDSIKKTLPFHEIKLLTRNGEKYHIKTYPVKAKPGTTNAKGEPLVYDLDYMYAAINDTDFVYIQYYTFDKILKPINYFKIGNDVVLKNN